MILGDIDTLKTDTRKLFESFGTKVISETDENTADCEKAFMYLEKNVLPEMLKGKVKNIKVLVLGAFGGRLDHTLQNLNVLWKRSLKHPLSAHDYEIMMFDNQNIISVLKPGHNILKLSKKVEGKIGCGLVPLTQCHKITTNGLKYNMGPTQPCKSLEFGEFISTSNQAVSDTIMVDSSDPLLWTSTIHSL